MKNAPLKSKPDTPKTPGGISKSLLTPCRRVGLSRNWKNKSISPFNPPLSSTEVKQDNVETRKRKESLQDTANEKQDVGTPTRKDEVPRRKKSKTLLDSITNTDLSPAPEPDKNEDIVETVEPDEIETTKTQNCATPVQLRSKSKIKECSKEVIVNEKESKPPEIVSTPIRLKSRYKKKISPKNVKLNDNKADSHSVKDIVTDEKEIIEHDNKLTEKIMKDPVIQMEDMKSIKKAKKIVDPEKIKIKKEISPNNLTKECVVVIQKKIFKTELKENALSKLNNDKNKQTTVSQTLFDDSDSDDVPLKCLNEMETVKGDVVTIEDNDDDFAITSKPKKTTSNKSTNKKLNSNAKITKQNLKETKIVNVPVNNSPSQTSDEDDDFFEKKRTILIHKSYDKVTKPSKAKSTGSITQKDIEDLMARIETKKKILLAKSMTDTKELRELIKKWQKGCQDALMELMNLMKNKCSDQNMEYSQILETLKIPAALVGYDSDNDCFVTPDDENIILSHIKES